MGARGTRLSTGPSAPPGRDSAGADSDSGYSQKQIDAAVQKLHKRTFESYRNWCKRMVSRHGGGCTPEFCHDADDAMHAETAFCRAAADTQMYGADGTQVPIIGNQRKMNEIVLWWCVWGEAGNMRFMPEFISWVFYGLVSDLGRPTQYFPDAAKRRNYLVQVIQPMYSYLKEEMSKTNAAGVLADHVYKKNYDDINEFFWSKECVDYSLRGETDANGLPINMEGPPSDVWDTTRCMASLRAAHKTYMERRGVLHSLKSNLRALTV